MLMKKLFLVVAVVAVALGTATIASAVPWDNPWDSTAGAFTVTFSLYDNAPYTAPPPKPGVDTSWHYYQFDVTLNGPTQFDPTVYYAWDQSNEAVANRGNNLRDAGAGTAREIVSIRGFAFNVPGPNTNVVEAGAWLGQPGGTELGWSFSPETTNPDVTGGAWEVGNSHVYLMPGQQGSFAAGFWADTEFQVGDYFDTLIHVNTPISGNTGWVGVQAQLEDNIVPPTPELSTWALLACTALFGLGFIKRRRA